MCVPEKEREGPGEGDGEGEKERGDLEVQNQCTLRLSLVRAGDEHHSTRTRIRHSTRMHTFSGDFEKGDRKKN